MGLLSLLFFQVLMSCVAIRNIYSGDEIIMSFISKVLGTWVADAHVELSNRHFFLGRLSTPPSSMPLSLSSLLFFLADELFKGQRHNL